MPLFLLSDSFLRLGSEAGKLVIEVDGLEADVLVVIVVVALGS